MWKVVLNVNLVVGVNVKCVMKLVPKKKSDVQLTGNEKFDVEKWIIPYKSEVGKEFKQRYDKIVSDYTKLVEEFDWNNIIYSIKLNYKPIIGNEYHLYFEDERYFLSLIAPHEWNKNCLGSFRFDHNGKWNKL